MKSLGVRDYHIHSNISFDGQMPIREICQEAMARGMAGLTFTEHWEAGYPSINLDREEYARQIKAARAEFPNLIIGMGMELGFSSDYIQEAAQAAEKGWDFIIGSCHVIEGLTVTDGAYGREQDKAQCYGGYLRTLCRLVKENPCFDVVGHLDLPCRAYPGENRALLYEDFSAELDALFETIIPLGIGIELNTAGWRYGLDSPHPHISVLKRYRELGGEIITCGSDAHTRPSIGYRLEDAYDILRAAGFKYVSFFTERRLEQAPL